MPAQFELANGSNARHHAQLRVALQAGQNDQVRHHGRSKLRVVGDGL